MSGSSVNTLFDLEKNIQFVREKINDLNCSNDYSVKGQNETVSNRTSYIKSKMITLLICIIIIIIMINYLIFR
jgi:hypothetical protein